MASTMLQLKPEIGVIAFVSVVIHSSKEIKKLS